MKLDEIGLRKPGFAEGVPIVLADGQAWQFPRPKVEMCPVVRDGKVTLRTATNLGREFDELIEESLHAEGFADELTVLWTVAVSMLRFNYDLADDDFVEILRYRQGDGLSELAIQAIIDVAFGNAPKPSPVG